MNAETQKRFHRQVEAQTGLKPGDVIAMRADGQREIAQDWKEVADLIRDDFPNSAEDLEGTTRGYVSLMAWANKQVDTLATEARVTPGGLLSAQARTADTVDIERVRQDAAEAAKPDNAPLADPEAVRLADDELAEAGDDIEAVATKQLQEAEAAIKDSLASLDSEDLPAHLQEDIDAAQEFAAQAGEFDRMGRMMAECALRHSA